MNRAEARKKRHSLSRKKIDENKGPVLLVIHSQQTDALFAIPSAEKGHQPRMPSQTISSAQPFFPFGKSSWAFFVSPSKRAQPSPPNHQSPQAPVFCESRMSALFAFLEKTEKGAKNMIIEVTPRNHNHPLAGHPHPKPLQKLPLSPCGLHLPGPGWRLPADRCGAAQ